MDSIKDTLRKLIAFSQKQQARERRARAAKGHSTTTASDEAYNQIIGSLSSILGDKQDDPPM